MGEHATPICWFQFDRSTPDPALGIDHNVIRRSAHENLNITLPGNIVVIRERIDTASEPWRVTVYETLDMP